MAVPSIEKVGQVQPTGGVGKRTHSLSSRWSSGTGKEISRQTRNVLRNCTLKTGNASGGNEDAIGFSKETGSIRALREKHVAEARVWANSLGLRAVDIRKACLFPIPKQRSVSTSTLPQTSQTSPTMPWVRSSDNVLSSWPYQLSHCCNFCSCWASKMEGAEPSPSCTTYRLTMRLVSAHISQWDVKFAGKWDSALKGNSALRAHVARAAGIELVHNDGQCVIHFFWDMRKFYDSIKAHLLIPQLVAKRLPEILVLGSLTHKSPRCLQVGNGYSDIINGCASSILAGCLQSCSWARGLLF